MPTLDLMTGLSRGQREALRLLSADLDERRDLSDAAKHELIEDRLDQYRQRNDERMKRRVANRSTAPTLSPQPARYLLGHCLDCSRDLWEHSPRPRVPICRGCTNRRVSKKHPKRGMRR